MQVVVSLVIGKTQSVGNISRMLSAIHPLFEEVVERVFTGACDGA
jgi:hypothetical protein